MDMGWSFWMCSRRAIEAVMFGGTLCQSSVRYNLPSILASPAAAVYQKSFHLGLLTNLWNYICSEYTAAISTPHYSGAPELSMPYRRIIEVLWQQASCCSIP